MSEDKEAEEIAVHKMERRTVVSSRGGGSVEVRMQVCGEHGGVEFVFVCHNKALLPGYEWDNHIDTYGVEYHWKRHNRPEYYQDTDKPHHTDCTVTGGECWHDGTSLWAKEHWLPMLLQVGTEPVWSEMEYEYGAKIFDRAIAAETKP